MDSKKVIKLYNSGKSTYEIAEELGVYPNKIRRLLIKAGIKIRDKSKAQSLALKTGRHKHPTEGTKRSEETKSSIGAAIHKHWESLSEDERQKIVEQHKKQWADMSETEKQNLRSLAAKAVRKAAAEGSKIEKFLKIYLQNAGFNVIFHKTGLIADDNLEIDLYIPSLKTAIEIDGPAHFLPIWGEKNLQRHKKADAKKTGLLIGAGFCLIRVKNLKKNISDIQMLEIAESVKVTLLMIKKRFPDKTKRYIEIEG